ncbi:MAG: hypothetical protein K0Q90_3108 [Paenibacillaceae bacterium]|jgi:ABC-2 type transport system ATP-binding protein|nr:hypothetical protein [Paenibacillaceae bacterium]
MTHIVAEELTKTYRVPIREGGLGAAFGSLFKPRFQEVKAVDSISFSIRQGEMVGVIGPNGAGKTTTLKMLSGLLYPTRGRVEAAGHIPWKREKRYLQKISLLMGNRSQMQWNNTVYDCMTIFRDIYQVPEAAFKARLAELASMLDVEKLMPKRVRDMSLGERSKCELILALLHRPEILYLDEPTLGMDVTMQLRLREYIREYNRRHGATVILTSHYMADITSLCPRVMLITGGRLQYDGPLPKLADRLLPYKIIKLALADKAELTQQLLDRQAIPAELTESGEGVCTLRVRKEDAIQVSAMLMQVYSLAEFSITDPPVEAVIDKLYSGEAGL